MEVAVEDTISYDIFATTPTIQKTISYDVLYILWVQGFLLYNLGGTIENRLRYNVLPYRGHTVGETWEQIITSDGIEFGLRWEVEAIDADGNITDRYPTHWYYIDNRSQEEKDAQRPSVQTPNGEILLRPQDEGGDWNNAPNAWKNRDWSMIGMDM
jgi:hypothetical protein